MKKLLFVFGLLIFMGCEDDKAAAADVNPLVGVWEGTELKIIHGDGAQETYQYGEDTDMGTVTYIFGADGIYSNTSVSSYGTESDSGTWSSTGGKLTLMDGDNYTEVIDLTISGNTLTLSFVEDGVTFTATFIRFKSKIINPPA